MTVTSQTIHTIQEYSSHVTGQTCLLTSFLRGDVMLDGWNFSRLSSEMWKKLLRKDYPIF